MAKTKEKRLTDLYRQARKDLSETGFKDWLCFCYGIFEAVAKFGRPIIHGDISIIEKEFKQMRTKNGTVVCRLKECERVVEKGFEYCCELHAILDLEVIDREIEKYSSIGKA